MEILWFWANVSLVWWQMDQWKLVRTVHWDIYEAGVNQASDDILGEIVYHVHKYRNGGFSSLYVCVDINKSVHLLFLKNLCNNHQPGEEDCQYSEYQLLFEYLWKLWVQGIYFQIFSWQHKLCIPRWSFPKTWFCILLWTVVWWAQCWCRYWWYREPSRNCINRISTRIFYHGRNWWVGTAPYFLMFCLGTPLFHLWLIRILL